MLRLVQTSRDAVLATFGPFAAVNAGVCVGGGGGSAPCPCPVYRAALAVWHLHTTMFPRKCTATVPQVASVAVVQTHSPEACEEGTSYWVENRTIWVKGCTATFKVTLVRDEALCASRKAALLREGCEPMFDTMQTCAADVRTFCPGKALRVLALTNAVKMGDIRKREMMGHGPPAKEVCREPQHRTLPPPLNSLATPARGLGPLFRCWFCCGSLCCCCLTFRCHRALPAQKERCALTAPHMMQHLCATIP